MTRFRKSGIDKSVYHAVSHVAIVCVGVLLSTALFLLAMRAGASTAVAATVGGVVALFGGFVLAEYEMAVGFGEH